MHPCMAYPSSLNPFILSPCTLEFLRQCTLTCLTFPQNSLSGRPLCTGGVPGGDPLGALMRLYLPSPHLRGESTGESWEKPIQNERTSLPCALFCEGGGMGAKTPKRPVDTHFPHPPAHGQVRVAYPSTSGGPPAGSEPIQVPPLLIDVALMRVGSY